MNNLSWLIYFAGAMNGLKNALAFAFFMDFIIFFAIAVGAWSHNYDHEDEKDFIKKDWISKKCLWAMSFILFIAIIAPSKDTVLAIAASEIGEDAVVQLKDSKYAKSLDVWIDSQLASGSKK